MALNHSVYIYTVYIHMQVYAYLHSTMLLTVNVLSKEMPSEPYACKLKK